jgi:hypothetical protein
MPGTSFVKTWNYLVALSVVGASSLVGGCSSDAAPDNETSGGTPAQAGSAGAAQAGGGMVSSGGSAGQAGSSVAGSAGSPATAGSGGAAGGVGTAGNAGAAGAAGAAGSGGGTSVDPSKLDKFSFFVTSMAAMQRLAKSQDGFGGDFTYGTGDGLMGADKICTEIAESSMPGSAAKQWRAFLSTKKGPVHAKDRIGTGPWYDRTGRLVAMNLAGLLKNRPNQARRRQPSHAHRLGRKRRALHGRG